MYRLPYFYLLAFVLITACNPDDEMTNTIETPANYEFFRDGQSTVSFSGQTDRIGMATELIGAMTDWNQSEATLIEMFSNATADADPFSDPSLNASTKSVKSKVAASQDFFATNTTESFAIKAEIESWISAQRNEVFPNKDQLAEAGMAGQIADGSSARYVNAKGLEYNQAVNKSLIGALMVDQILNNYLSTEVLDAGTNMADNDAGTLEEGKDYTTMEHKWDEAFGYLFGASGTNPTDPISTLGEDAFLNKYLKRVDDDPDFSGIANTIIDAFKLGRAAIVAGDYDLRDDQAAIIRENISTVIAARAVYYLQSGKNELANENWGSAFHDLSEGFGFVYSLRFVRPTNSNSALFSKSEVDGLMDQLLDGNGFWDVSAEVLNQISQDIADKFEFTLEQAAQ